VVGCFALLGFSLCLPGCGTTGSADGRVDAGTLVETTTTMETQGIVDLLPAPVGEKWGASGLVHR